MSEKETACLRDITETDIMEYMQVEHPHNEKELWKMKHATPARIGIGTVRRTLHDRRRSSGFWRHMRRQTTRCSMKCRRKW